MKVVRDTYSEVGHAAWRHWFDRCAIDLCEPDEQSLMKRYVSSSIRRQLTKYGEMNVEIRNFDDESLAHEFDAFMQVGGTMKNAKPMKKMLAAKFNTGDDNQFKQMICGGIFSKEKGLVKDIARKALCVVGGVGLHTPKVGKKGRAVIVEGSYRPVTDKDGNELEPPLPPVKEKHPEDWPWLARGVLMAIGGKTPMEASLLAYAIVNEVSPSNKILQKHLGVGQVQTYKKFNQAMQSILSFMKKRGLTSADTEIIRAIQRESACRLGAVVVRELAK